MILLMTRVMLSVLIVHTGTYSTYTSADARTETDRETAETSSFNKKTENVKISSKKFMTGRNNSIKTRSNCGLTKSLFNITTVQDRAVLISFSYNDETKNAKPFPCWVYMTSSENTVLSLLYLYKNCSKGGSGTITVSDTRLEKQWKLCERGWSIPGPDFTTSSNVANVSISVSDITTSFEGYISIQAVPKPTGQELEMRYLSATQGYIQTPAWSLEDFTTYPANMDSLVSIPVPEGHMAMITVLFMDLEDNDCQYDWLEIVLRRPRDARTTTTNIFTTTMAGDYTTMTDNDAKTDTCNCTETDGNLENECATNDFRSNDTVNLLLNNTVTASYGHVQTSARTNCVEKSSTAENVSGTTQTNMVTTMLSLGTSEEKTSRWEKLWKICGSSRPDAALVEASQIDVFFHSDSGKQYLGTRVFFSFHQLPRLPLQTPDGKWNCSVPYWSDFKFNLMCNLRSECIDGEDEDNCIYRRCTHNGVEISNTCHFRMSPKPAGIAFSWNDAQLECRKFGSHLASLTSPREWYDVMHWLRMDRSGWEDAVYVGLATMSSGSPHMYNDLLQWDDLTVAYFSKHKQIARTSACGTVSDIGEIYLLSCSKLFDEFTTYQVLCEKDESQETRTRTASDKQKCVVQVPSPSYRTPPIPHVVCPSGHYTNEFLACDAQSDCWGQGVTADSDKGKPTTSFCPGLALRSVPPSFSCSSGAERVPYSMVCDHSPDCLDSSDEDFCVFPPCSGSAQFQCNNKQCLSGKTRCDHLQECRDGSDEDQCDHQIPSYDTKMSSIPPPAVIHFDGRGSHSLVPMANFSQCPETHFQCPDDGYCLPVYVRCNGVYDCPGREDEEDCASFTCPGFYRCRGSHVCLHSRHVCDGWPQCPQHDDERFCNLTCPDVCVCYGYAFTCSRVFNVSQYPELRYLDAKGSEFHPDNLEDNYLLVYLSLSRCGLRHIGNSIFPNLRSLDLSYNNLRSIDISYLNYFPKIVSLALAGNPLVSFFNLETINSTAAVSLLTLDLSFVELPNLESKILKMFPNLQSLNLSQSHVQNVQQEGFQSLQSLRLLDARGCAMTSIPESLFRGIVSLQRVFADNYKLCCPAMLPTGFVLENCEAPFDEISSCDALLRSDLYRVILAIFAALSTIGNTFSFVFRVFVLKKKNQSGFAVFVTHLCVADFLMGLYLVMIGVADRLYLGSYLWEDVSWKNSVACKVAGFLSLLSSEISAFIICLVTVDRFLVIRFPFSGLHFRARSAQVACMLLWAAGIVLAAIPLLPVTSHWSFYSQTGICIPLPVTRQDFLGRDYAFGIMIVFNFILFLFIAAGQMSIYAAVRSQAISINDTTGKSKDLAVARRLLAVVLSDFLCWFPIGLLGLLASQGIPIPGEVNVGMAIFVLPLNSALNPFLYTFNMIQDRRMRAREEKLLKMIETEMQQAAKGSGTEELNL